MRHVVATLLCVACSAGDPGSIITDVAPSYGDLGDSCESASDCLGLASNMQAGGWLSIAFDPDCALMTPPGERVCGFVCDAYYKRAACNSLGGTCVVKGSGFWCVPE